MPGIYGKVSSANLPSDEMDRMTGCVRHYDWYNEEQWGAEGAAFATLSLGWSGRKLYVDCESGDVAALAGEIYDEADHRRRLVLENVHFKSDDQAELCLRGFKRHGLAFFAGVNGKFAVSIWDAKRRLLTLIVDRFGMLPCYYVLLAEGFAFANEITALLAGGHASRRPNPEAIVTFFAFHQYMGDATVVEGICRIPPASGLTYGLEGNRCWLERYWDLRSLAKSPIANPVEALDRIDHAFVASIGRCTNGAQRLGLSLSGGLDSRAIMAAVSPSQPVSCVTLGVAGGMDLRLASRLAKRAGRPFHACILDAEFLSQYEHHLRRMIQLTEAQTLAVGVTMPTIDLYRRLGIRVLLRGHGGELMHMHRGYSCSVDAAAFALRDAAELENWAWRHLAAPLFREPGMAYLTPRYRNLVEHTALTALRKVLGESDGVNPLIHRLWLLFIRQLLPNCIAPSITKYGTVAETRMPYIDADLIAALLSAPPALKLRDSIHAHLLRRHAPDLFAVPNTNTGAQLGAGLRRVALSTFVKRVLVKLRVPGYQPYERLGLWLRREEHDFVERTLLSQRCLDRGVFERSVVRAVINDHVAKRRNNTYPILAMLNFELGQRQLIDGEV